MRKLILSIAFVSGSLVSFSQSLFVYSDTCYFYNYSKNQDIDSRLSVGITPYGLSSLKTTYEFNVDENTLVVTEGDKSPMSYSIKEYLSFFDGETVIHCRVVQENGDLIDVFVFVDFETNNLELRTDSVGHSDACVGSICPNCTYEFR
jgi:hypothetical protein